MLELKSYSAKELTEIFKTDRLNNIERSLKNYKVDYIKSGQGENTKYEITAINDELRLFCIMDLGFAPQTDMKKLTNFLYLYLNVEEFVNLPDLAKETFTREAGRYISRQTIANYTNKLINANYIARSSNYIYYFVLKDKRTIIDKETYKKAWREYFQDKENGASSDEAIFNMIVNYGGYASKYAPTEKNGIYLKNINHLNELVCERIEQEYEANNTQTFDSSNIDCQVSDFFAQSFYTIFLNLLLRV